jgi:hypothetical protein
MAVSNNEKTKFEIIRYELITIPHIIKSGNHKLISRFKRERLNAFDPVGRTW